MHINIYPINMLTAVLTGLKMVEQSMASLEDQTVLSAVLDHLANGGLALGSQVALLLTLQELLQVFPHVHLPHVGPMVLLHLLLLLSEFLSECKAKTRSNLASC